jgi:hypothetical protein
MPTEFKLATGGPPGSRRQNLWLISAGATAEVFDDLGGGGGVDSSPVAAITNKEISAGVFGKLDAGGKAYKVLPDNDPDDVTVYVKGDDHHAPVTPSATEFPLVITANGITLSNDVVAAGANFCVGQDVPFTVSGWPTDGSVIATNFQWTLQGTYFNDESSAVPGVTPPTCSYVPYVNSSMLASNATTAWWVSGGFSPPIIYTASVTCDLIFTNGSAKQTVNGSGLFTMFRPQATVTTKTGVIGLDNNYFALTNYTTTNIVGGVTNYVTGDAPAGNVFALHYGIPSYPLGNYSSNGMPGIVFSNTVRTSTNFSGDTEWIQVVNNLNTELQSTNGSWAVTALVTNAMLDNFYPYLTIDTNNAEDSPAQGMINESLYEGVSYSGSFSMSLLFKPSTGGHWVPLSKVDWSWIGIANSSSGLTYANNTINPTGVDTLVYPYWTDTVTNQNP